MILLIWIAQEVNDGTVSEGSGRDIGTNLEPANQIQFTRIKTCGAKLIDREIKEVEISIMYQQGIRQGSHLQNRFCTHKLR